MSSPSAHFPPEVIDLVVGQISQFQEEQVRDKTLASTALVSWYFRHRAHGHLFANVHIRDTRNQLGTERVRGLRRLMDADPQSEASGIASYIRSFGVHLVGPTARIHASLDDGTLTAILRRIFKTQDIGARSLSLSFLPRGNLRNVFDWTSLNTDFISAFHNLCRNPTLTTLHLAHFVNLPRTLLHHSYIKNVRFSKVQLANTNDDDDIPETIRAEFMDDEPDINALEEGQAVPLESIDTDHSLPLLDLIDMTPEQILHPKLAFSQLKGLTAHIGNVEDFHKTRWILVNAASTLNTLEIILFTNDELPDPHWRIGFSHLSALKTISIIQNSTSYKVPGRTCIPQICMFMKHLTLHPNLEEVNVSLFLYSQLSARTPLDIFEGHDFSPLDGLFSHGRFFTLKTLTIQFVFNLHLNRDERLNLRAFQAESADYIRGLFTETAPHAASGRLQFNIDIIPHIRRK